jgi:hypothetical protein
MYPIPIYLIDKRAFFMPWMQMQLSAYRVHCKGGIDPR